METERIFAETNLFLRYLTNDVPEQAEAFEKLIQKASRGELELVTNVMVIAELVWTLESYYRLPRQDIRDKVLAMLNTPGLEVVEEELILPAIIWYQEKNVDFIDAYNAAWLVEYKLDTVCTFDRKHFARIDGIKVLVPGS
jgi:predicted nucleic acid-binding protein